MPKAKKPDRNKAPDQSKRDRDRASYIRVKQKAGKPVSEDELAFVAEYDGRKHGNAKEDAPAPDAPGGGDALPNDAGAAPDAAPDAGAAPDVPTMRQPLPGGLGAPPSSAAAVHVSTPAKRGGRWQDNHPISGLGGELGGATTTSDPRELTCIVIAGVIYGVVLEMQEEIEAAGLKPVIGIKSEAMQNCYIHAVDDVLPADFVITPTVIAAASASGTVVQRFVRRAKIAAALDELKRQASRSGSTVIPFNRPRAVEEPKPAPAAPAAPPQTASTGRAIDEQQAPPAASSPSPAAKREPDAKPPGEVPPLTGYDPSKPV